MPWVVAMGGILDATAFTLVMLSDSWLTFSVNISIFAIIWVIIVDCDSG
jgi:hypothetical protein